MVFIAEYNKRVYYTRDKENFNAILKAKKGALFKCLYCGDVLYFVNEHERTQKMEFKSSVTSHFRHTCQTSCEYERRIDAYMKSHSGSSFHKSWTFDLIKADFLFRHWYNPRICDIKTPNGIFVFVRDAHQTEHNIIEKEAYSSQAHTSKPIWILNGTNRPFTLRRLGDTLYILFQGKSDVALFSENHRVILDTHTDKLIEVHLDILPHPKYGFVVNLINYKEFIENTFEGCILPNIALNNRRRFDIPIKTVSDTIVHEAVYDNDFITYYTIINNITWFVRQSNKTLKISTHAIPINFKILNGMKVEMLGNQRFINLSLPKTKEAFDAFSQDVQQQYKSVFDESNDVDECYNYFCDRIRLLLSSRTLHASLQEYKRYHKLGKEHEDKEKSIMKKYREIVKSVDQLNSYNQVLLRLQATKYKAYESIKFDVLFKVCRFVEDVDDFIANPFSLHVRYWVDEKAFIALEHIAIASELCKSDIILAHIRRQLFIKQQNGETCVSFHELTHNVWEITEGFTCQDIRKVIRSHDGTILHIYNINHDKGVLPMVFLKEVYDEEYYIASKIYDSTHSNNILQHYSYDEVEKLICTYEKKQREINKSFRMNNQQKTAIHSVIQNNFTLMTGYPGTGKSDVVKCLCYVLLKLYGFNEDDIALCAPTGKAATKLEYEEKGKDEHKNIHIIPQTVHKLIKYKDNSIDGDDWDYEYDQEEDTLKTFLKKKIIVVDEVSMLGYKICCKLLSKINVHSTKIFFIGDRHQLPSVDYGQLLYCLTTSKAIENHVRLVEIHRYGKAMQNLALDIKRGIKPNITNTKHIQWHKMANGTTEHEKTFLQNIFEMSKKYNNEKKDNLFQVIVPTKEKTKWNADKFNTHCHTQLHGCKTNTFLKTFVKGERVMCNKNFREIMNGEFAYVVHIKESSCIVVKRNELQRIDCIDSMINDLQHDPNKDDIYIQREIQRLQDELDKLIEQVNYQQNNDAYKQIEVPIDNLEYCYAITIHKSQGSEWDNVVVVLTKEHSMMLNRNLLYTAVTRVRKGTLHIFYDDETTIAQAVEGVFIRQTCLKYILRDMFNNSQ
jgi:hypothetical protein